MFCARSACAPCSRLVALVYRPQPAHSCQLHRGLLHTQHTSVAFVTSRLGSPIEFRHPVPRLIIRSRPLWTRTPPPSREPLKKTHPDDGEGERANPMTFAFLLVSILPAAWDTLVGGSVRCAARMCEPSCWDMSLCTHVGVPPRGVEARPIGRDREHSI